MDKNIKSIRFKPLRTTQAVGVLLYLAGGRLNYTKTLKLLYLADRRSLIETGTSITGDRMVNMTTGPILSSVYDYIKGNVPACKTWCATLKTDEYDLIRIADPGDSELSDYDVEILTELFNVHKHNDHSTIYNFVHDMPEWHDPGQDRMSDLEYVDVLRAVGVTHDDIVFYEYLSESLIQVNELSIIKE